MRRFEAKLTRRYEVRVTVTPESVDPDAGPHRQCEVSRVRLEVLGHAVFRWKRIGVSRKRHACQAVEPCGSEEPQRVPAGAPRIADAGTGIEDDKAHALTGQVVTDAQPGLPASNHDGIETLAFRHRVHDDLASAA